MLLKLSLIETSRKVLFCPSCFEETAKCDPQSKEKAISSDTPDVTKTLELVDNDLKQLVSPCARAYDE